MTHGTLGARLVADLVTGRPNELASVYSPSRMMPGALRTLLGENLNMAAQFTDWLTGGDVKSADEIHGATARSSAAVNQTGGVQGRSGEGDDADGGVPAHGVPRPVEPGRDHMDCPCHGHGSVPPGRACTGRPRAT